MPSTLFISLTDCSSPNPRAVAAAAAAPGSRPNAWGRRAGKAGAGGMESHNPGETAGHRTPAASKQNRSQCYLRPTGSPPGQLPVPFRKDS